MENNYYFLKVKKQLSVAVKEDDEYREVVFNTRKKFLDALCNSKYAVGFNEHIEDEDNMNIIEFLNKELYNASIELLKEFDMAIGYGMDDASKLVVDTLDEVYNNKKKYNSLVEKAHNVIKTFQCASVINGDTDTLYEVENDAIINDENINIENPQFKLLEVSSEYYHTYDIEAGTNIRPVRSYLQDNEANLYSKTLEEGETDRSNTFMIIAAVKIAMYFKKELVDIV